MKKRPQLNKVHCIRKYRIGALYVEYVNGIRHTYRYIKIDGGVLGKVKGKVKRWVQYMWAECR